MQRPKLILFGDPKRPNAAEAMEQFIKFAVDKADVLSNCLETDCDTDALRKADYAVVFGGDGTILGAARQLCETKVPVIGVNVGKLGFLAEFSIEELTDQFERIISDGALIEKRMVMHCNVFRSGKQIFVFQRPDIN